MPCHLQTLDYAYELSPAELGRRERWLRSNLASNIQVSLPLELRHEVSQYLLREYAAAQARSFSHSLRQPFNTYIDLSSTIWVQTIAFEGIEYIASLTNQPGKNGHRVLFTPDLEAEILNLYIAQDY